MKHQVVVSARAALEIETAVDWWARERSSEQAQRWYRGIRSAIDGLAQACHRYPVAIESDAFPYEIRELHFGLAHRPTHRVVFTIRGDRVVVLSVRHTAQDSLREEDLSLPE